MVKTQLVSTDIETGGEIVKALDAADLRLAVALWAFLDVYEDWRLVLSSRRLDVAGHIARYRVLREALSKAGIGSERSPNIQIFEMSSPFVRDLRKAFAKTKSVEGMRLGGQRFGNRFLEDAYIYRIK